VTVVLLCLLAVGSRAAGGDPLASAAGKKAVVLLFIARDCPISNAYAPEIGRICARYTAQKVAFYLVYPDPDTSLAAAKQHAKEYGYTCPVLLDPAHRLARKAGATVTPEAAVFAPGGKLLYRGRIDDLYLGFGRRRDHATRHDLRDALDAVLGGRPVPAPRTQAIGCFL
jgi:thiol-disulfide isomerase/thioredoxin